MNRQEKVKITRLRNGHTSLNSGLNVIVKHPSGACPHCGEIEGVEHAFIQCNRVGNGHFSDHNILGKSQSHCVIKAHEVFKGHKVS